jgi:ferrous iron transport protein A
MTNDGSLGDLSPGDSAVIGCVACARATSVRLMEMGLCRGTRIEVRRVAPLGDPMEIVVSGCYSVSIRRTDALGITVRSIARRAEATVQSEGVSEATAALRAQ